MMMGTHVLVGLRALLLKRAGSGPPRASSAAGFVLGQGQWVLGPSIPGQHPHRTAQDPSCRASALGEPHSPKSFCKHPAALPPGSPSSGGLYTVKGSGSPPIPISQPPLPVCPMGSYPVVAHTMGIWLLRASAHPVTLAISTQPQPQAGRRLHG